MNEKSELDKLIENLHMEDPYFGEWSQEASVVFGWARCKQKIVEILKQEIFYSHEEGDIISVDVIEKIENL